MLHYRTWLNVGPEIRITVGDTTVSYAHDTIYISREYTWEGCAMRSENFLAVRV